MTIDIKLASHRLTDGEDIECARAIEAATYAAHLLESGVDDPRLQGVVVGGEDARERLVRVGFKMAMQMSHRSAAVYDLPVDDLFQDACVAVMEAIPRYDHTRGVRFTTFVHEYLFQALAEGARHRMGAPALSRGDRRAARRATVEQQRLAAEGHTASIVAASLMAGVSPTAALRGHVRHVNLDDLTAAELGTHAIAEDTTTGCLDYLDLLDARYRRVLERRYGLRGRAQTLMEIAQHERASPSTVSRWIQEALDMTRELLAADRTRLRRG